MREAMYWEPLEGGRVRCRLCPLNCIIDDGQRGSCKIRKNIGGKLYTLNYGKVSSVALDPVEKKPLFHFWPGSCAFSIGTVGCNMHCKHCQNWEISQGEERFPYLEDATPEGLVAMAKHYGCENIAYTYNEPTIWYEFVLETARLAKREGLNNILVTNGYINEEPFRELAPYIDAMNIDIKAFDDRFYMRIASVLGGEPSRRTAVIAKKEFGIHVELTYLIIPTLNDEEGEIRAFARWVVENLGDDTPVHFSRFYPHYKLLHLSPTPLETLEKAYKIAKEEGLKFVYLGNVPGHDGENTYCPRCGRIVIGRWGFAITEYHVKDGKCQYCGEPIPIVGRYLGKSYRGMWW
ncbi:AmmeMemoRadiSam system radical SAM enzyme [Pyrococcus yayanosii]|uniref:Pyruvate formate-lyase activating enzyme related protein n=1 Tax=Pyrococcus yayanosii (strain CH1 / JCM 16557) TaxID=529709 RepID=F8AIU8_PYRYC|nr:AmmeMemoRadiSam system radical SAM enzyme [Pyrococcus yayanosii]AEH24423.1 pyruvate formate-lyase activating enzyme related protein [Pyrococcus yayanosii CH1]